MEYKIKVKIRSNVDGFWSIEHIWFDGDQQELTIQLLEHYNLDKFIWEYL